MIRILLNNNLDNAAIKIIVKIATSYQLTIQQKLDIFERQAYVPIIITEHIILDSHLQ